MATAPSDGYGHGTHIAGLIAGTGQQSNGRYVGVAPRARLIGLKVLDGEGRRLHERRHRRDRLRHRQQGGARHRRHQPVARPPDLRARRDRPAGAGGGAAVARRHRRRGVGRQHRHQPDDRRDRLRRHHLARQRAVGDHGRLGAHTRRRATAATTRSRRTARAGRRGTTAASSRTSSRPGQALVATAHRELAAGLEPGLQATGAPTT